MRSDSITYSMVNIIITRKLIENRDFNGLHAHVIWWRQSMLVECAHHQTHKLHMYSVCFIVISMSNQSNITYYSCGVCTIDVL